MKNSVQGATHSEFQTCASAVLMCSVLTPLLLPLAECVSVGELIAHLCREIEGQQSAVPYFIPYMAA
jgi:hypothetical protein